MMRMLFLSRWLPYPPQNGSKLRIYSLLRGLCAHHDVTLLTFNETPNVPPDLTVLKQICADVQVVPYRAFAPGSWQAKVGFFSTRPRSAIDTYSPEMALHIERILANGDFDLVIASQIDMADYYQSFAAYPAIFEEVEVGLNYEQRTRADIWQRWHYSLGWVKKKHYLARLLPNFRVSTAVSEQEKELLRQHVAPDYNSIEVIPNCVNLSDYDDVDVAPQPNSMIFAGSFTYGPNYEAMVWFLKEVYFRIQMQLSGVHLTITGNHADKPLPPASNVTLTGFVDDVRPYIQSSWLSLAPIWQGGGTRLKILESIALRTPVVATSKGAEGLNLKPEEHILIADTPEAFAQAVLRLLQDPGLRQRLSDEAYEQVSRQYDWAAVLPRFLDLVENVANRNNNL